MVKMDELAIWWKILTDYKRAFARYYNKIFYDALSDELLQGPKAKKNSHRDCGSFFHSIER